MIDTVKLRSPYLSNEAAGLVEQQLSRRSKVQIATGEVEYEITSDELEGSYDTRIMVRLMRDELVYQPKSKQIATWGNPVAAGTSFEMRPCQPYLIIEGSVHKALVGHNITGGPTSFQASALWFVDLVAELLWVSLPHGSEWLVEKIDVTECYQLSYDAIEEFIGSLNAAQYPRRKPHRYGQESLFFPGTTTALKLYHKGPEFAKHDAKKLRFLLEPPQLEELQMLANGILRVEVSIKAKKLKADYGEKPTIVQVTDAYLEAVHDREVARVLKEGKHDVKTVRTALEVSRRLHAKHGSELGSTLYGVWVTLATHGELEAKKIHPRSTYYRHRRSLIDAGCSWAGTDIVIRETRIPIDFTLSRQDRRRDVAEDPRITLQLSTYRNAA